MFISDNSIKVRDKINYYCNLMLKSKSKALSKSFYYSANGYLCCSREFNLLTDEEGLTLSFYILCCAHKVF